MNTSLRFPVAAVVGQEQVKTALLIALVNPKVGGVLIAGEPGTAKSCLVRSLPQISNMRALVELPLNASDEMVFGYVDLELALAQGRGVYAPGILARAHQQLLYIDEINLLRRELLAGILAVADRGINILEREGLSHRHLAEFILIGSFNPDEGELPRTVLDRFGLMITVEAVTDPLLRVEIMRNVLTYECDPEAFVGRYLTETNNLRQRLLNAQRLLPTIEPSLAMLELAAQYATKANTAGHRAELFLIETAKAIAALADRSYLLPIDMEQAAQFVLPHRWQQAEAALPQTEPPDNSTADSESQEQPPPEDGAESESEPESQSAAAATTDSDAASSNEQQPLEAPAATDDVAAIDPLAVRLALGAPVTLDRQVRQGSGKRSRTRTASKQGRYVRAILPPAAGTVTDLALDATLRAAAPYQGVRPQGECALTVYRQDLRQKVREKRIGNVLLFVVDASGSMGAQQRMRTVKGAILALLQDAYQKRDQVGMIAFRRQSAEVVLPITRSVELAQKCLATLPTGGKTPLAAGLQAALSTVNILTKKQTALRPILVIVTDGRANSSSEGGDAVKEALSIAEKISKTGVISVVVDTERDFIRLAIAKTVATAMGATYYHVQDLSVDTILPIVTNLRC